MDFSRALVCGHGFAKLSRTQCICEPISVQTVGWAAHDTCKKIYLKAKDVNTWLGQGGGVPTLGSAHFRRATVRCIG